MSDQEQLPKDSVATEAASPPPNMRRKRLLLIEDEPTTRLMLLNKLRTAGFDVDVAPNGRLALKKLRISQPDAIFMDMLLPYVKGVEVIKRARNDSGFGDRPIYVCTSAVLMTTWTRRGTKAGATKVFNKATTPIDKIVAEVAADLIGPGLELGPSVAISADTVESKTVKESPTQSRGTAGGLEKPPPVVRHSDDDQVPVAESPDQPVTFMKRVMKSLGLVRSSRPTEQSVAPVSPVPMFTIPESTVAEPGTDASWSPMAGSAVTPPLKLENRFGEAATGLPESKSALLTGGKVAVLTLDAGGKIISADDACRTVFGWEGPQLVGQNVMVLLKNGLDNELGRFLEQENAGKRSSEKSSFRVIVRKKDGTEFPASVTPLTWRSDTTVTRRSDDSRFLWTAVFSDLASRADSPAPPVTAPHQDNLPPTGQPMPSAEDLSRLQESQARLRNTVADLQKQLEAASADAAMHREALAKGQKEREELLRRICSPEADLQRVRAALQQATEERKQFEHKLQDLAATKAELEKQLAEQRQGKDELLKSSGQVREQAREANAAVERAEAACKQEAARARQLEEELAKLRQTEQDLTGKLTDAQQAAEESTRRGEELQSRLSATVGDLENFKADAGKRSEERGSLETELRAQLDVAKAAAEQAQVALKEEAVRSKKFEERLRILCEDLKREQIERTKRFDEEVAGLRQVRDDLQGKLTTEQQAAAESARRAQELEGRLRDSSAEAERVKAELESQTAAQQRLEAEWRDKLNTAEALTNKAKAAWSEAQERNKRFAEELTGLRQVRDRLNVKLTAEQQAAAQSKRQVEELESRLRENAVELERVRAELEQAAGNKRCEMELASLYHMRDLLDYKLATEQHASDQSRERSDVLEDRLRQNTAELERIKANADKHAEEQTRLQSELLAQLNAARTAAGQAEAELKERAAQCSQFESELASLRQVRDELDGKLTAEQQAAVESKRRNEELESRLRENAAELGLIKEDADRQSAEQTRLEAELRAQLDAAKAAAEQTEAALKEEAARHTGLEERLRILGSRLQEEEARRTKQFEEQLASLQRARDELSARLTTEQQAAAESRRQSNELEKRLRESAGELENVKAQRARQAEEQTRLERELQTAKAATEQAEAALKEKTDQVNRLEQDASNLRKERQEIQARFAQEQQAAAESRRQSNELETRLREFTGELEGVKAERTRQGEQQAHRESELRAAAEQAAVALKEKTTQFNRLEQEVSNLRKERQEIHARFAQEQQAAAKAKQRCQEFEKKKRDQTVDMEKLKSELESQTEKARRLEGELREQLEAARAEAGRAEASLKEAASNGSRLDASLIGLRQERDKLQAELTAAQRVATETRQRQEAMETRLRDTAAELERARQDAENHSRLESENRNLAESKEALAAQLCLLREGRAPSDAELLESQRQVRESAGSVARITADLEKERGERRRAEQRIVSLAEQQQELHGQLRLHLDSQKLSQNRITELEQRLRQNEDQLVQVNDDLQKERTDRQLVEQQLQTGGALSNQLRNCLAAFDEAKKGFKRAQEQLESKLQTSLESLKESDSKLHREAAERQRQDDALATAQRALQEQSQHSATELCRLQAELEEARAQSKHLEGNAIQSRYASLNSARAGLTMVNRLRTQVREPVDGLMHATRRLLEIELQEEPKKLVEAVLQNALLVQTTLQEAATLNACLTPVESAPPNDGQSAS